MLALAALSGAMLAGCTPEAPVETTPPPTSAAPTVSEEEARAAWEAYQSRLSELDDDPGAATEADFREVATAEVAEAQMENFALAANLRVRIEGERSTTQFSFDAAQATAAVCVDVSDERYLQNGDVDVTDPDAPLVQAFAAAFERDGDDVVVVSGDSRDEAEDQQCAG